MADNVLTRKAGPLKVWQWGAIGGGLGLAYLFLHKGESGESEAEKLEKLEAEENLLGGANRGTGGAGGGGVESVPATPLQSSVPGPAGEVGVSGAPGATGETGPPGESPSASLSAQVASLASKVKTIEHHGAPQAPGPGWIQNKEAGNPRQGQYYKVVKGKNGKEEHVYKNGAKIITKKASSAATKAAQRVKQSVGAAKKAKPTALKHRVAPKTTTHKQASAKITPTHSTAVHAASPAPVKKAVKKPAKKPAKKRK